MKDYYKTLGISPTADEETIKKSYRTMAKQYHPDLHQGDSGAEARFKEIAEAYSVLSDSKQRGKYDSERTLHEKNGSGGKRAKTAPVGTVDFEEMMRNFSGSFSEESIKTEAEKVSKQKDPFNSDEMFKKFMGFK